MLLLTCSAAQTALEGSPPRSAAAVRAAQVDGPDTLLERSASLSRETLVPRYRPARASTIGAKPSGSRTT